MQEKESCVITATVAIETIYMSTMKCGSLAFLAVSRIQIRI